jgi:tetratricopeptide (TPR) repeat protein
MANASVHSPGKPPGQSGSGEDLDFTPPPSQPLRIFLFCAFLVTVAAYIAGQWSDRASEQTAASAREDKLHRQIADSNYLVCVKLGFQAQDQKRFDAAVSNFQSAALLRDIGEAHYNLANALLLQSRTNEALKEFQAAQALDPKLKPPVP